LVLRVVELAEPHLLHLLRRMHSQIGHSSVLSITEPVNLRRRGGLAGLSNCFLPLFSSVLEPQCRRMRG
jgi:hypothetical protein